MDQNNKRNFSIATVVTGIVAALICCIITSLTLFGLDKASGNNASTPTAVVVNLATPTPVTVAQAPTLAPTQVPAGIEIRIGSWPVGDIRNWRPEYDFQWNGMNFTTRGNGQGYFTLLDANGSRVVTGFPQNAFDFWLSGLYKEMFPSGTSYEVASGHTMIVRLDNPTDCGNTMSTAYDPCHNATDGVYRWAVVLGPTTWVNNTGTGVATLEYATYAEDVLLAVLLNGEAYDLSEWDINWGNWQP